MKKKSRQNLVLTHPNDFLWNPVLILIFDLFINKNPLAANWNIFFYIIWIFKQIFGLFGTPNQS